MHELHFELCHAKNVNNVPKLIYDSDNSTEPDSFRYSGEMK